MRFFATIVAPFALAACAANMDSEAHPDDEENTSEAEEALGAESPYPAPGGPAPGGHDMGGPGADWGSGICNDPLYAPYCRPRDPDPHRATRTAQQREWDRIHAANVESQRRSEASWSRRMINKRGEVILRHYEGKIGKGFVASQQACRYACTTTGRDLCIEVLKACQTSAPLFFIPEVPVSCAIAIPAVCAGRTPFCFLACAAAGTK